MSFIINDLSLSVGKKQLLSNVSLEIKPGEVLALLGPNGAGKSSLLKSLSGEHAAARTALRLNAVEYDQWPIARLARTVAVLPQQSELSFPFSVEEVVLMGRLPHATGLQKDREIAAQAMQYTDVFHLKDSAYPSLSGGERQRVQLARVLAQIWHDSGTGSRYLLLDEPTSALDLSHQHQVLKLARQMAHEQQLGVMAILHDLNLAASYADRVALLVAGQITILGTVEQVLTEQQLSTAFGIEVTVMQHPHEPRPLVVA